MNDWFRSWHGAPTDPKWLLIARKADVAPGVVAAVVWALLDHASQCERRGDVSGFDIETYAAFSGFEEARIEAVLVALREKNIIAGNRLAAWDRRQPKREDGSAERAAAWREHQKRQRNAEKRADTDTNESERSRTQPNAEEHREEQRRLEQKVSVASASYEATATGAPSSDLAATDPEQWFWDRAAELERRGVVRSHLGALVGLHGGNWRTLVPAMRQILIAKAPAPFIGAMVRDLRRNAEAEKPQPAAPPRKRGGTGEPDFVRSARAEGVSVLVGQRKNGRPSYRIGTTTFDEGGQEIGF